MHITNRLTCLSPHLQHAPHLVILGLQPGKVAHHLHIQIVVVQLGSKMNHRLQHTQMSAQCTLPATHLFLQKRPFTLTVCSRMVGFVSMKPCATWGKIWSFTVAACKCPANSHIYANFTHYTVNICLLTWPMLVVPPAV